MTEWGVFKESGQYIVERLKINTDLEGLVEVFFGEGAEAMAKKYAEKLNAKLP